MEREFSAVSTPDLVAEITTLAGHLNAANARLLGLIAELDRRRGWAEWGVKSCAHWLNWKCGISLGAAREKVRVARTLASLPRVAAAMAEGRLSYFKVRELTRVADAANEAYLLNIALCGTATHVEETVRGYRRARLTGEHDIADGLPAWAGGEPNVAAPIRRYANIRGDIDSTSALDFLRGLLVVLRDCGYPGLLVVLDEIETLQRMRSDSREKSLNTLRQLIDAGAEVDGYASDITRTWSKGDSGFAELVAAVEDEQ